MTDFVKLWVYLSGSPLLWLTATLVAYVIADAIATACRRHPLANPVLIAVILVASVLLLTGTAYPTYFAGAQFVHFLLGPATVALAVPLIRNLPHVKRTLIPMAVALLPAWICRQVSLPGASMVASSAVCLMVATR